MGIARLRIATKIKSCPKGFMGVGTASSKLKLKKMMQKNEMVATTNANENVNAVATASVELDKNKKEMNENQNLVMENQLKKVKATINGKTQEIILARHKYSREKLTNSQLGQLELIDKTKMLDVLFHITDAEIFYTANIDLFDYNGTAIPVGTPNVFVPIETADTFYRFEFDDTLNVVRVHKFADVQEYASVTGTTNLFSKGLSSKEKMGVAALATNNEVCNAIYDLSVATNMPASTAQLYLNVQVKGSTTSMMTTGYQPKDLDTLGRTYDEAVELHKKISLTFGVNEAKKRYAIRAINYLQKTEGFTLNQIHEALDTIPANEVERAKLMKCGDKEICIVTVLIEWMKGQINQKQFAPAA